MEGKDQSKRESKGWRPNAEGGEEAVKKRSQDLGESAQFVQAGHYNQETVTQPKRRTIDDDDIVPPGRL
jgi:hypothetical protein